MCSALLDLRHIIGRVMHDKKGASLLCKIITSYSHNVTLELNLFQKIIVFLHGIENL